MAGFQIYLTEVDREDSKTQANDKEHMQYITSAEEKITRKA